MAVADFIRYSRFAKPISASLAVAILAVNLAVILQVRDEWVRLVWIDVSMPLVNFLALATLVYAARLTSTRLSGNPRLARALWILAAAQACYFLGDLIWMILEAALGLDPFPSLADVFYLAYFPLSLLGILLLPTAPTSRIDRSKALLDMGIILLSVGLLIWVFVLGPLLASGSGEPWLVQALSLAYPLGDLLLLSAMLVLAYQRTDSLPGTAVWLLAASMALGLVTDSIFSHLSLTGGYQSGGMLDLAWMASFLLLGLFAIWQVSDLSDGGEENLPNLSNRPYQNQLLTSLPYMWLAIAFVMLLFYHYGHFPIRFEALVVVVAAIIILVLLRQIFTLQDISRLSRQLETAFQNMRLQTQALEVSNQELHNEIEMRRRAEQQLLHDAFHDALTDLPNRVLLLDRLRHAIAYSRRHPEFHFAVLFLDLDQFKVINDCWGHTVGDQLLIQIARHLRNCLRESDTVARLGGDEFVILLEDFAEPADVERVAENIQQRIRGPYFIESHKIFASVSIGVVYNDQEVSQAEDVLRDADTAMYHAKSLGRARAEVFQPALRERLIARMQLEADLRRALENGEFCLYYQPILSLHDETIVGFEALVRWNHPERGLVSPAEFVHLAEETGLILPLGFWVLREACRQFQQWRKKYPQCHNQTISVNISGFQFHQPDLVDDIALALADHGLDGRSLRLEITESVYLHQPEIAILTLNRLKDLGIGIHIDDFGTGYSSLSYLQIFPIETIKIDRSFIKQVVTGEHSEIVRTVISLAHDLGMRAVAEGVETAEQFACLKSYDCDYAQGYWFSPPLPADEVESKLLTSTSRSELTAFTS